MRVSLLSLSFLLVACGESDLADGDSTTPAEGTATLPPTSAEDEPGTTDGAIGDPVEDPASGCPGGAVSWELEELWHSEQYGNSLAVGHTEDTNGDGWVSAADEPTIYLLGWDGAREIDADGSTVRTVQSAYRLFGRVADVDGEPGAELVLAWDEEGTFQEQGGVFDASGSTQWEAPLEFTSRPWLADLDEDGDLDMLVEGGAADLQTGEILFLFEENDSWDHEPVAADLDLDGDLEILGATRNGQFIGTWNLDGTPDALCLSAGTINPVMFAIGDLDGDAEGEVVAAGQDFIAVCDSDMSLLHRVDTDIEQVALVGIGDLDGDGQAQIVVMGATPDYGLIATYDADLTERWWVSSEDNWYLPFSMADLDADGDHEILYVDGGQLVILGDRGKELATWGEVASGYSWRAQPIVTDLDGDGLGEILFPTMGRTYALDNTVGGFPIPDPGVGWSGIDHHPGLVAADGSLDPLTPHWMTLGHNAWNGGAVCTETGE